MQDNIFQQSWLLSCIICNYYLSADMLQETTTNKCATEICPLKIFIYHLKEKSISLQKTQNPLWNN